MAESENEYGCVRCQAYHGESDGPVYAEHLMWQSKHGTRRRPKGGWLTPEAVDDRAERRRAFRAGVRADAAEVGKSAAREGAPDG